MTPMRLARVRALSALAWFAPLHPLVAQRTDRAVPIVPRTGSKHLLYRVTGSHGATVYLLGSVHLLTAECATLYKYHLKPDGLLALHISNRWLDLKPPARGLAHSLGWRAGLVETDDESGPGIKASSWVIVSGNTTFFNMDRVRGAITEWTKDDRPPLLWRDDFTSLWPLFVF